MFKLRDLPNTDGFRFLGIHADGSRHPCKVAWGGDMYRISVAPWDELEGWEDYPDDVADDEEREVPAENCGTTDLF